MKLKNIKTKIHNFLIETYIGAGIVYLVLWLLLLGLALFAKWTEFIWNLVGAPT